MINIIADGIKVSCSVWIESYWEEMENGLSCCDNESGRSTSVLRDGVWRCN